MQTKWTDTHNNLMLTMQKEVTLLRDLLTNLHQEEISLLMHDRATWNQLKEERANIVKHLEPCRQARAEATQKLSGDLKAAEISMEEILPSQDENSCEVLLLRDQIVALTERMNRQSNRNQILFTQVEKRFDLPPEFNAHQPAYAPKKSKRISVTTYPFKEP